MSNLCFLREAYKKLPIVRAETPQSTVLSIAKAAEIRRTTVYSVIEALKKKGLMYVETVGFKQLYTAEHPSKLENMLQNKQYELERLLPDFTALYNLQGGEERVRVYEGLQSIQQLYMDTLLDVKGNEDYLVITDEEQWYYLDEKVSLKYIEARAKKCINTRLIFTDSPIARKHKKIEKNRHEQIRIFPKEVVLNIDLVVTPKRVIITQTKLPYKAIEIQTPSIIEMQKNLFEIIWNSLPKNISE